MSDIQRPPLWRVMFDARCAVTVKGHCKTGEACAAEIRALRDVVVPEEPEPLARDSATLANWTEVHGRWRQRMEIRAQLTAEAERAERGEQ